MRCTIPRSLFAVLVLAAGLPCAAQEWTRFRGPNGSGIGSASNLPLQWTQQDILWKAPLPGPGHASPVLWGDKLFIPAGDAQTGRRILLGLDARTGRILWQREFASQTYRMHNDNSYATATPVVDESAVYFAWTTPAASRLIALDHAGKDLWQLDLPGFIAQHGSGASPMLFEDLVILPFDQENRPSEVLGIDRRTGRIRWRTPRNSASAAYSTPCIYQAADGKPQLILSGRTEGIAAFDPRSGQPLWKAADIFDRRVVSSPLVAGDLVLGSCGEGNSGRALVAIRPPGEDRPAVVAWKITADAPYVPTSLYKDGRIFLLTDSGLAYCVEASTGKRLGQRRLGVPFYGSFACDGSRLYAISRRGEVFILSADEKLDLLARNPLGEPSFSTPAIAHNRLYLRTASSLFCVGKP